LLMRSRTHCEDSSQQVERPDASRRSWLFQCS